MWIEQIAALYSQGGQNPALVSAPCAAQITQLPIPSHDDSAARKGNCPVFMTLGLILILRCCDFAAADRNVAGCEVLQPGLFWKDRPLQEKGGPSFHIHQKDLGSALSGKEVVLTVTGGRVPRPQS